MKLSIKIIFFIGMSVGAFLSTESLVRVFSLQNYQNAISGVDVAASAVTDDMVQYLIDNPDELKRVLEENGKTIESIHMTSVESLNAASRNAKFSLVFWLVELACFVGLLVLLRAREERA